MKARPRKEASEMFKEIRKSKGFSLEELAEMTGGECTASDLDLFEKGDWSISAVGFIFMCKALEIENPDDILYEEI